MNDQSILEQLARHPKSRAVQLADRLDQALEDVQAQLAALIAVGDVISESGLSPAQQPCQLYSLSAQFLASDKGAQLTAKAEILAFREQNRTLGTAALAIAFIAQRGQATSTELSVLLGLRADQYPSAELRSSVQGERLVCVGRTWTLGPKGIPSTREQDGKRDGLESGAELGRIDKPALPVPTFIATPAATSAPTAAPTSAPELPPTVAPTPAPTAAPAAPRYRFARWSDGQVEVQRNGLTLDTWPREVADDFVRFLTGGA